jgi:hypothetical protein
MWPVSIETLPELSGLKFQRLIWLLPCGWLLHEAEEWNILAWYQRYWVDVPQMEPGVVRVGLGLVGLVGLVWTFIGTLAGSPKFAAFFVLPFFTILAFGNAVQHIYFVYKFQAYAPGVVTAVILVIPSVLFLTYLAVRQELVSWWYAAAIYLPAIPAVVTAVQAGNKFPSVIREIYGLSESIADKLSIIGK